MTHALTTRALQRRYVFLSGALWLPAGLMAPILVLLLRSRGLDLPTVGVVFAIYSGLVIILEVPSGSFADIFGRRRTMIMAGVVRVLAMLLLAVAREPAQFVAACGLYALSRALQGGPLEAWYVDSVHGADPDAPVQQGISRGWAAEAIAIAVGAVVGGFLPRWFSGLPADGLINPFSVPLLLSTAVSLLGLIAFGLLMTEAPRGVSTRGLRGSLLGLPSTVADGLRLATQDRYLRILLTSTLGMGFAISALEVLAPVQFAAQLGGEERASAAYGVLVTLAFLGTAGGSMAAPRAAALSGSASRAAAWFTGAIAVALLGLALGTSFAMAAGAFVMVYLLAGVPGPLQNDIAHGRVEAGQRATLLSINSLAQQLGGLVGSLSIPALAGTFGFAYGWAATAAVVLTAAGVLLLLPRQVPTLERSPV